MKTKQPLSGILSGNIILFGVEADHFHPVGSVDPPPSQTQVILPHRSPDLGTFLLQVILHTIQNVCTPSHSFISFIDIIYYMYLLNVISLDSHNGVAST